ncbi:hypothetical protein ACP70R_031780 [Stipagrostis hirtigluma subsp. patula]
MANLAVLLLTALVVATTASTAASAGFSDVDQHLPARRSRFLLATSNAAYNAPLPSSYDCSKKSAAVCLAPGSPGPACCGGRCVDTVSSADHCGGCHKVCKHGRTCCGGRCVDLLSDKDSCGSCFNQCGKKCTNGFCDYAL